MSNAAALCSAPCGLCNLSAFVQLSTDSLPPSKKLERLLGKEKETLPSSSCPNCRGGTTVTNLTGTLNVAFTLPRGLLLKSIYVGVK